MKITPELTHLFNAIDSVIHRSGNRSIRVIPMIALEQSQEGGIHRVNLMDALSSAVNGIDRVTPHDDYHSKPWYSNPKIFIAVSALAVSNFQRN